MKLRIPWVTRRWHETIEENLVRQLQGCQQARLADARMAKRREQEIRAALDTLKVYLDQDWSKLPVRCDDPVATAVRSIKALLVSKDTLTVERDAARKLAHQMSLERDSAHKRLEAAEQARDAALAEHNELARKLKANELLHADTQVELQEARTRAHEQDERARKWAQERNEMAARVADLEEQNADQRETLLCARKTVETLRDLLLYQEGQEAVAAQESEAA